MKVACEKCGAQFFVDENKLKKDVVQKSCPKCSSPITIRKPPAPEKEEVKGPSIDDMGGLIIEEPKEGTKPEDRPLEAPEAPGAESLPSWIQPGVTAQIGKELPSSPTRPEQELEEAPVELTAIVEGEKPLKKAEEPPAKAPVKSEEEEKVWKVLTAEGKIFGPFAIKDLARLIEDKRVSGLDRVSKSGAPWEKAFTVPDLAALFSRPRPAPQTPPPMAEALPPRAAGPPPTPMERRTVQEEAAPEPVRPRLSIPKISLPRFSMPRMPAVPKISLPDVDLSSLLPIGKYLGIIALVLVVGFFLIKFVPSLVKTGAHHAKDLYTKMSVEKKEDLVASYSKALGPVQGTPEDHFQKGVKYFALNTKEGYLMAEEELKKSLALKPQYPQALATLAETFLRGRDLKADPQHLAEAKELAKLSTTIDPKLADGYMVQAYLHELQDQREEAKLKALRALEIRPNDLGPNYLLGSLLLEEKRETEAAPYLERAAKAKPDFAQVRIDLTSIYSRAGDMKSALPHWRALITIDPKNGEWQCGLADALSKNNLKDEAVKSYTKCVEIVPDNVPARTELVSLLLDVRKRPKEAREHLEILLTKYAPRLTPQQVNGFHTTLGRIYLDGDMAEAAIKEFESVIAQDPRNPDAHYYLGEALYRKEKFHDAEKEFRTVIQIDSRSGRAHVGLGNVLGKFGRLDLAIEEYKTALGIDPTFPEAHYILGTYYAQRGLTYEAIDSFKNAIKYNPDHLQSHYELGMAAFKVGDNALAIRELKRAKEINPRYEDVSYHLGEVYFADGKIKLASKEYKDYLARSPKGTYAEEAKKMVSQYGR